MMTWSKVLEVKICGITRIEDALAAAGFGADCLGLIMAPGPRQITLESATRIARELPATTSPVLLFVDRPVGEIVDAVDRSGIVHVQLHGGEDAAYVRSLHDSAPWVRVIRAWPIRDDQSGRQLRDYVNDLVRSGALPHRVILDLPKRGVAPPADVIDAAASDWPDDCPRPWRAGGLRPETVAAAVVSGLYAGVDVAAGVESSPGVKDHERMARFIATAKRCPGG